MPNKYEREIEEILRNLEQADPNAVVGQKFGEQFRRKSGSNMRTRQSRSFSWNLSTSEWLLLIAIVATLVAGGYEYIVEANILTLILAIIGIVCVVGVALSQFFLQPRRVRSTRYGNVTITPLRQTPWSALKTRWNLFKLKMRYRRKSGR